MTDRQIIQVIERPISDELRVFLSDGEVWDITFHSNNTQTVRCAMNLLEIIEEGEMRSGFPFRKDKNE